MAAPSQPGAFLVSLDFELYWGVRDTKTLAGYSENLQASRQSVIPALLRMFERFDTHATWATVGFLFAESRDELLQSLPTRRPHYRNSRYSPYEYLHTLGEDEEHDPCHFAPSLIRQIAATHGQEIGSHTFSHYYCLEDGQTVEDFRADLQAAVAIAQRRGIRLRTLVFPRNQANGDYLKVCRDLGFVAYRGNQRGAFYQARSKHGSDSLYRRGLRLLDAYLPLTSSCYSRQADGIPLDLPASRFLRPHHPSLGALEKLRLRRITRELTHAAQHGLMYHLWWHPHNFGRHTAVNLQFLEAILTHAADLRHRCGLQSLTMTEAAETWARVAVGAGA